MGIHTGLVASGAATTARVVVVLTGLGRGLLGSVPLANTGSRPVYGFRRGLGGSVGVEFRVIACSCAARATARLRLENDVIPSRIRSVDGSTTCEKRDQGKVKHDR